jgi:hypothetical protein
VDTGARHSQNREENATGTRGGERPNGAAAEAKTEANPAGRAPGRRARHSVDQIRTLAHRARDGLPTARSRSRTKAGNQDDEAGVKTRAGRWPPNAEQNTEQNQGTGTKSMEAERNCESDAKQKIERGEELYTQGQQRSKSASDPVKSQIKMRKISAHMRCKKWVSH